MQLDKALADRSWTAALEQTGDFTQLPLAIISDVDETLVDNSPAQARAIRRNLGYFDRTLWNEWVNERGSSALPGAVEFARYAASRGVTIFYVTNRTHEEEPATRDNLTRLGFEVKNLSGLGPELEDTLLTRGPSPEKRERRAAVARHYRILLLLGDDLGDFLPEIRTTVGGRAAKSLPHEKMWGDRWIVLPNPSYGSWEGAVTGSRPGLADEETLRRKREALRDR